MRERLIPRIMNAEAGSLVNDAGTSLDPVRIWSRMMTNEKPGGHGERSIAVSVIDMAVWDAIAKIEEKPLYRLLAERYNDGEADAKIWVYAAGGYYHLGKDNRLLQDEVRGYLDQGYTTVKMKIGGGGGRTRKLFSGRSRRNHFARLTASCDHPDRSEAVNGLACEAGFPETDPLKENPSSTTTQRNVY